MSIGQMKPIILERWGQSKGVNGSLQDTLLNRYRIWAEVVRQSDNKRRSEEQVKLNAGYTFKTWFNNFNPDGLYKIVYEEARFNIHSIEKVKEKRFNYFFKTEANVS